MYSAKKIKGKKLYTLARKGIEIERKAVKITINRLQLLNSETLEKNNEVTIDVVCGAGTYIRTLAEDIGKKLGVGAHLSELRRTRAGKFSISQAISLESLEQKVSANEVEENLISMNEAVSHLPEKRLDENELIRIQNGLKVGAIFENENVQTIRLTDVDETLVAIGLYEEESKEIQPRIVFSN
jgi:tRNA pseudouridine55 synthase